MCESLRALRRSSVDVGRALSTETVRCADEVAAYAIGALDAAEGDGFRDHLADCVVCHDELAAFQRIMAILPISAPDRAAPKGLRRRVLADIRTRQPSDAQRRWPRRPSPIVSGSRRAVAVGALLAVVLFTVSILALGSSGPGDTKIYRAQVAGRSGSAQLRVTGAHAELVVHHLEAPPAGQMYEVWLLRGDRHPQPTSALFNVTASGGAGVDVPGNLHGVGRVMVTTEPANGSRVPTHSAVITADLT